MGGLTNAHPNRNSWADRADVVSLGGELMKRIVYVPKCPTCGRDANRPFRSVNAGCVDEYHTGHVWDSWHLRKEARQMRKDNMRFFGVIWTSAKVAN